MPCLFVLVCAAVWQQCPVSITAAAQGVLPRCVAFVRFDLCCMLACACRRHCAPCQDEPAALPALQGSSGLGGEGEGAKEPGSLPLQHILTHLAAAHTAHTSAVPRSVMSPQCLRTHLAHPDKRAWLLARPSTAIAAWLWVRSSVPHVPHPVSLPAWSHVCVAPSAGS